MIMSLILWVIVIYIYFLPWMTASSRKTRNVGSVAVINIFLGWTFLGWVIALAMAFSGNRLEMPTAGGGR